MPSGKYYELLRIGLTQGEAKVYLALLELGPSTVGPVVKKAGVAYSNVYDILNRLIVKGIVSFVVKSKTRYYQAVSPSNLLEYLDRKEREIITQKAALKRVLPELLKFQEFKPQLEAEVLIGTRGLKTAYERLFSNISDPEEDLFFYIHEKEYAQKSDNFYFSVTDILKIPKKIRGIANEYARKSPFLQQAKFLEVRFVDFPIPGNIEVCAERLLLISWKEPIIGVLIHSKSIAENFRSYFETAWKIAKE